MATQVLGKYCLSPACDDAISCLAFSINGEYIATGGLDRKLQIFYLGDGQLHYVMVAPSPIKSLIWLPGAEGMLVCACQSGMLINIIIRAGVSNLLRPRGIILTRITPPGFHGRLLFSG